MTCDTETLADLSKCFECLSLGQKFNVLIYLFAQLADVTTDPKTLADNSKCFSCLSDGQKWNVLLWIACNITGGGGSIDACLVAQSGAPVTPCAFTFGLAYDNDSTSPTAGSFWFWDATGAAWVRFSV